MLTWNAFLLARLASVLPCALAAVGETSAPRRTVSVLKVLNSAASLTTASNSALLEAGNQRLPFLQQDIDVLQRRDKAFAEFLRLLRVLRGVDAARLHDHMRHQTVEAFAVEGTRSGVPHVVHSLIVGLHGIDADGGGDDRDETQRGNERKNLGSNLH